MVQNTVDQLTGEVVRDDVEDPETGAVVVTAGTEITREIAEKIAALQLHDPVRVVPRVSDEILYLSADREDPYTIAQANATLDDHGRFLDARVVARKGDSYIFAPPERVDYIDVAPVQMVGVSAALIPFLEHDDANRALMGSNMQRQAVPLISPEAPLVGTGIERSAALNSGLVVTAKTRRRCKAQRETGYRFYKMMVRSSFTPCRSMRAPTRAPAWISALS